MNNDPDDDDAIADVRDALKGFTEAIEGKLPREFFGAFMVLYRNNGTTIGALYGSPDFKKLFYPHEKLARRLVRRLTLAVFKDKVN